MSDEREDERGHDTDDFLEGLRSFPPEPVIREPARKRVRVSSDFLLTIVVLITIVSMPYICLFLPMDVLLALKGYAPLSSEISVVIIFLYIVSLPLRLIRWMSTGNGNAIPAHKDSFWEDDDLGVAPWPLHDPTRQCWLFP